MEFYKKYRPKTLARMVGNETTVQALTNMLERNTLPHTLLFTGPSGCGKTTLARILKQELDCLDVDFKEMNCADFRGIDTIREISRTMNLAPMGKCRIWLLDEAHQLSKDAQNGALKILEDTPKHVYFFLCTTDQQKLLKTIRTRCCEMSVSLLNYKELEKLARRTMKREKIELDTDTMEELVAAAVGSARMLLVLLDKIANLSPEEMITAIRQKMEEENEAIELCRALISRIPWKGIAEILKNLKGEPETIRYAVLGYARAVLLNKCDSRAAVVIDCFRENFYDSKQAGLTYACYDVLHGE